MFLGLESSYFAKSSQSSPSSQPENLARWVDAVPAQTLDILLDQDEGSQTENIHLIRIFKLPLSLRFKLKNFFVPFQTDNEHITQFLFVAREALKHYFRWER